jgi:phosphosulfolactate synthase (CoM biosynthesis protein A)
MNALAFEYCTKLGLPMTSGSDIHFYHDKEMGGMLFDNRIDSVADYVDAIKKRTGTPVSIAPDGTVTPVAHMREQTVSVELPTLPVLYPEGK